MSQNSNDEIILCTYQQTDWKEYKNSKWEEFKRYLGVSQDTNIYWCFSGRTVEEAIINSFTVTVATPMVFVMILTNNYYKIDKIKWLAYIEGDDYNKELTNEQIKDLMTIEHEDAVEYIIAGVPEKYFETKLDYSDLKDIFKRGTTESQKRAIWTATSNMENTIYDLTETIDFLKQCEFKILEDRSTNSEDSYIWELQKQKKAFENIMLSRIYIIGLSFLFEKPKERNSLMKSLFPEDLVEIDNVYTQYSISVPNKSYENAYKELSAIHSKLFNSLIVTRNFGSYFGGFQPNSPCACGSGKKYKKCCGKGIEINVSKFMSYDEQEIKKLDKWYTSIIKFKENIETQYNDKTRPSIAGMV